MSKSIRILIILCVIFVSGLLINATIKSKNNELPEPIKTNTNTHEKYAIKALKIPEGINFAGELVPVDIPDIRERMDKELLVNTYWQSNGLLLIKRANKYFSIIEPILEKNNVPNDFKYLAVIESGLQNVTSPAGAKGFWQIMKNTALENGLEVNDNIDERYHIEKSTEVACQYLIKAKERLGSWTLAAAAYNGGNYGIARRLEEQQVDNYYDLLLGEETGRYVFRIIALKEILSNPSQYGFIFDTEDLYNLEKTKIITVDSTITNLAAFAKNNNTNYKELKIHNPWLREKSLNNKTQKTYYIKLPI